ncbi:MAG: hypothetical protein HKP27_02130 [Myxococcales bacterium]|nr:hypothetical protein [Myxococcales bacterium]
MTESPKLGRAERPKLGQVLRDAGVIDDLQLRAALGEQNRWGGRIGAALVGLGHIEEDQLVRVLARELGVPAVRLEGKRIDASMADLIDVAFAKKNACVPLFEAREGGTRVLYLGMEDPHDLSTIDDLRFRLGLRVRAVLVGPVQLRNAIATLYAGRPDDDDELEVTDLGADDPRAAATPQPAAPADEERDALYFPTAHRPEDEPQLEPEALSGVEIEEEEQDRGGQVPTRQILRAVTRLLLAKGVFNRDELLKTVRIVGEGDANQAKKRS